MGYPGWCQTFCQTSLPLPAPPPRLALPAPEVRPVAEGGRGPTPEDRWAALRTSRRSQGLCVRCGGKWSRDPQCPATVQLNVVQELLDLFQLDEATSSESTADEQAPTPLNCCAILPLKNIFFYFVR